MFALCFGEALGEAAEDLSGVIFFVFEEVAGFVDRRVEGRGGASDHRGPSSVGEDEFGIGGRSWQLVSIRLCDERGEVEAFLSPRREGEKKDQKEFNNHSRGCKCSETRSLRGAFICCLESHDKK